MNKNYLGHIIGAWKLAGRFDSLYYGFIDGSLDYDIKPSKYPAVVIRRIQNAVANRWILENRNDGQSRQNCIL